MKERENFGSRMAVIMAFAGSAIGLGNIWRFPYLVGQDGGAAFVIIAQRTTPFRRTPRSESCRRYTLPPADIVPVRTTDVAFV